MNKTPVEFAQILYSEDEKQLFIDFLITKKTNSKQNFENYLKAYLEKNGTEVEEQYRKAPKIQSNIVINDFVVNYRYESHNIMWDNNDNLVTYILSHPDFEISNKKLKNLNLVHPDWHYVNAEGNNCLHLLAKRGELDRMIKISKDFKIDKDLKNKNEDYCTFLLLHPDAVTPFLTPHNPELFIRENTYINKVVDILEENMAHIEDVSKNKIIEICNNVQKLKDKLWQFMEDNPNQKNGKPYDREGSIEYYNQTFSRLDKLMNYIYLDAVVDNKTQVISKKVKI